MGLVYLIAVIVGLIVAGKAGYVLRGKVDKAWSDLEEECLESCRVEVNRMKADRAATHTRYTMLREGLASNRIRLFDEVMDFINACGVEDEYTVSAILAGNPIHVDGADVVFRVAQ
jgi:hypothetical protein